MNYKIVAYAEAVALIAIIASFALYNLYFTSGSTALSGARAQEQILRDKHSQAHTARS